MVGPCAAAGKFVTTRTPPRSSVHDADLHRGRALTVFGLRPTATSRRIEGRSDFVPSSSPQTEDKSSLPRIPTRNARRLGVAARRRRELLAEHSPNIGVFASAGAEPLLHCCPQTPPEGGRECAGPVPLPMGPRRDGRMRCGKVRRFQMVSEV